MTAPLDGVVVVVLRPARQAGHFVERVTAAGATAVAFPTLRVERLSLEPARVAAVLDRPWDWVIYTSVNAVEDAAASLGRLPAGRVAAIGRATARVLEARDLAVEACPAQADSEGLLSLPVLAEVSGRSLLIVKGLGGRNALRDALAARGALVEELPVYRRTHEMPTAAALAALVGSLEHPGSHRVFAATSVEVLEAVFALAPGAQHDKIRASTLLVPGPRVAAAASALRWRGPVVGAATAEDRAMFDALARHFAGAAPAA